MIDVYHVQVSFFTMLIEYLETDLSRIQLYIRLKPKNAVI
mgnify:FL=1